MLRARKEPYWGGGPYLDELQFIDLGDDPTATFHDKRVQGFKAHPALDIFGHQLALTT